MSTGEAGPPLVPSGEQIRQREFATVRRGYDPSQVRAYLASLAAHVEGLERALADAQARASRLESAPRAETPATDPYEQLSKRFAGVLATADSEAEALVQQARNEAARIKAEAQARAEEVRLQSSKSLIDAQLESDRMLENLSARREAMLRQLHDMQSRLLSVADDLEVAIQPTGSAAGSAFETHAAAESADPAAPAGRDATVPAERMVPVPPNAVAGSSGAGRAPEHSGATLDALWVNDDLGPSTDAGLAGLFHDPEADDIDLPDLSGIDLELDDQRDDAR
ncbi:MAG: DivIVA domain-containing protein [Actinomycetota bacterium]|nr:DivIVA domain-containing protein [Actinomycetota bacterium]